MPVDHATRASQPLCLVLLCTGLLALCFSGPASALYKCVADKKTTFQELPCQAGAAQTVIRSPSDAPPDPEPVLTLVPPVGTQAPTLAPPAAASPAAAPSDQEKLATLEAERLKREATYALRDKQVQAANHQASCERNFGVVFSRGGPNGGITGAVYQQSVMGDLNINAQRCIARANELQQEVGAARLQCASRGCDKS